MTPRQRVHAAMSGQPVDRVPVFAVTTRNLGGRALGRKIGEFEFDFTLAFQGMRAMWRRFGFDGLECGFGAPREAQVPRLEVRDGVPYLIDANGLPFAEFQEDDDPIPLNREPLLKEKSDLDKITVPLAEEYEKAGQLEPIRQLRAEVGDGLFIAGTPSGQTMNSLAGWRGSEEALYDLIDDPEFVDEVMDLATARSIEAGKAYLAAGVDALYIGDAWSSASIISPRQFERFCLPRYARAVEAFHALGTKVYIHICGNVMPILEMIAETGVDCLEPLDPLGGTDVAQVVKRIGDRVSLKGGVNTLTLLNGTPDEVRAETRKVLEAAWGKCRGFILGSGDDIPRDTPFENLDAMIETARNFT